MGDLSAHFNRSEFRDHRTGAVQVDPKLVQCLENLRRICGGKPLHIVSGYRSASTNKAVGGASKSQHLYGRAADIPKGYATVKQAILAGFTGVGDDDGWATHVDVRPGSRVARWHY